MEVVKQVEITRIEGGCLHTVQDALVIDHQLKVYVNGRLSVEFLCLPANLEELVCGHLFALGGVGGTPDPPQVLMLFDAAAGELLHTSRVAGARQGEEMPAHPLRQARPAAA